MIQHHTISIRIVKIHISLSLGNRTRMEIRKIKYLKIKKMIFAYFTPWSLIFSPNFLKACQIKTHSLWFINTVFILVWVTDQTYFLWKKIWEEKHKSSHPNHHHLLGISESNLHRVHDLEDVQLHDYDLITGKTIWRMMNCK